MPDSSEAVVSRLARRRAPGAATPARAAVQAKRALKDLARPSPSFDANRYFRADTPLGFHNVGTGAMRALARSIYAVHREQWTIADAMAFAEILIVDRHLETKSVGIEVVARYRRDFTARNLIAWKRWLARGDAANWATTDAMCGVLIGPLLADHPPLADQLREWTGHRSLWVRRASAVVLIPSLRKGRSLDLAYDVAQRLHGNPEDLMHKAVGWMLREAGKADPSRLERYLRHEGASIPRTTVRYAIERMPPQLREDLLAHTRGRARKAPISKDRDGR